ncbi:MAG: glycoside hydrolase family 1 protein [Candidatus Yanofskybacteria bacterium]|nr:glycoside hydrolase family 1 protein [Candidatus Yanofskybacteria bacterium]
MIRQFPEGFLWGTATSAHQIEGDNIHSDWWKAEQEGKVPHKSGRACDSYNRYEEDFDLAKAMHNNAHRFSLEWARIEPEEGKFTKEEIEHYRKVIRAAKERGLEPFVTLHHISNPRWFIEKDGWKSKNAPKYFARYVQFVAEHLGMEATYWITMNEPDIWNAKGYLSCDTPPFKKWDIFGFFTAQRHMARAHQLAYEIIHTMGKAPRVGIAQNQNYLEPAPNLKFANGLLVKFLVARRNFGFLDSIQDFQDFMGINYYNHYKIHILRGKYQDGKKQSDFGWEIFPEGIYYLAKQSWDRYGKPIFILENGIADADDDQRPDFIREHLVWLHRAIEEGADVRGYFHWSLLDNFEWAEGFTKRFGLVHVDFETFKRTPRPSAKVYAEICRTNSITG